MNESINEHQQSLPKAYGLLIFFLLLLTLGLLFLERELSPRALDFSESQTLPGIIIGNDWAFNAKDLYSLAGTWKIRPNKIADYNQFFLEDHKESLVAPFASELLNMDIPGTWKDISAIQKPYGYATYGLRILLPATHPEILSLHIPSLQGASRIYVDSQLLAETGTISIDPSTYIPQSNTRTVSFQVKHPWIDILIVQVNFSDQNSAFAQSPVLGSPEALIAYETWNTTYRSALSLGLIILGLYLCSFFLFRRKEPGSLYLGLFSLLLGLRYLFIDTNGIFGFNNFLDWENMSRIHYICYYLAVPVFAQYLHSCFPKETYKSIHYAAYGISFFFISFVCMAPKRMYQALLPAYHVFTFMLILYGLSAVIRALIKRQSTSLIFLFSLIILFSSAFIDILISYSGNLEFHLTAPLLLFFLFVQAILLSWRFNKDYHEVQELSETLKKVVAKQDQVKDNLERDILERTRDMSRALDLANKANEAKSQFLANISHEIRTPLNGIIGFTELLSENPANKDQERYTHIILNEANRLLQLINQLLDISKIEADKLVLEHHPLDLHRMFQSLDATMQMTCRPRGLNFYLNLDERVPQYIMGDALRLRQILDNILSNATKFTEQGSVTLSVYIHQQNLDYIELACSIADTGIGIPYDQQTKIFESFQQADSSTTRLYGGSGLGTTIAKKLVELMQGKIWFESTPGTGSTFWFIVRLALVKDSSIPQAQIQDHQTEAHWLSNPACLLAEDYEVNAEITSRHLQSAGWQVKVCTNGEEALRLFESEHFDLILLDIQMPLMDGYTAARKIRERTQNLMRPLPILALSANAFPEDRKKAEEAGMNGLIPKPTRRHILLETLAQFVPPGSYVDTNLGKKLPLAKTPDYIRLLQDLDGDLVSWLSIIKGFATSLTSDSKHMKQALDRKDSQTLHRLAHSTKGGAANIGARDIQEKALLLEKKAKEGDLESCAKLLPELITSLTPLIQLWN